MSVRVMSMVWESKIDRDQKYILLCLADFGNDDGKSIYPSVGYIVWKTGYSERQVRQILRDLRQAGYINVDFEGSELGTNEYRINLSKLPIRDPYRPPKTGRPEKEDAEIAPTYEKGGAKTAKVGAETAKVGAETAPNPLVKPLEEPLEVKAPVAPKPGKVYATTFDFAGDPEFPDTPEGKRREAAYNAMQAGAKDDFTIKTEIAEAFSLAVNWKTKTGQMFLTWLKGLPEGQTVKDFAAWWYAKDWRGKRGQPPEINQIMQLWPQAFKNIQASSQWTPEEAAAMIERIERAKAQRNAGATAGVV